MKYGIELLPKDNFILGFTCALNVDEFEYIVTVGCLLFHIVIFKEKE